MSTMIMTTPPRINNTLDKEERARLVRSTRKLGAVLGTTPLLVEVEAQQPARTQKDKIKREGRLFSHSASASLSSFGTSSSATVVSGTRPSLEGDYVVVRRNGPSAPYQVQAVFDNASPPSSRSASPMRGVGRSLTAEGGSTNVPAVSRKRKQKQSRNQKQLDVALELVPSNMLFPPTSGSATHGQGTGSGSGSGSKHRLGAKGKDTASVTQTHQPYPTQPLLLRLRSAPISGTIDGDINVMDVDSDKASIITTTTQPLSPASATFNMSLLTIDPFLSADYSRSKALSDKEKRRKMAKLARTLGENVPPELVFRPSNTESTTSSSSHTTPRRRASLSIKPYFTKAPTLPPLAVAEAPRPSSDFTQSQQSNVENPTKRPSKPLSRPRPRPASLMLGSASAFVAVNNALSQRQEQKQRAFEPTRGTNSLDIQRQQQQYYRPAHLLPLGVNVKPFPPSPRPFLTVAAPISHSSSSSSSSSNSDVSDDDSEDEVRRAKKKNVGRPGLTVEWGRRKEREWSGEWNLRDMEDVAMKLRCLKGR